MRHVGAPAEIQVVDYQRRGAAPAQQQAGFDQAFPGSQQQNQRSFQRASAQAPQHDRFAGIWGNSLFTSVPSGFDEPHQPQH
mmetsp:Transcript_25939/g.32271  ORF Transcript_25939/g.32271 Transcript_25939/m.32271 type:complete len:82 (-) Transcript_25939:621-866(-)